MHTWSELGHTQILPVFLSSTEVITVDTFSQLLIRIPRQESRIKNSWFDETVKLSRPSAIKGRFYLHRERCSWGSQSAGTCCRPPAPETRRLFDLKKKLQSWWANENTMVTHLFAGDSLLTFILEFFFGGKPVSSSTHPFRGVGTWSWAHLTLRQHENWLICGMSQITRYQNIQMTRWRRDSDRCRCRRRRREPKTGN